MLWRSLGRGDVLARIVTDLINAGQVDVVCKCFQELDQMGHDGALAQVSLAIAKMGRPDIIATVTSSSLIWHLLMRRLLLC